MFTDSLFPALSVAFAGLLFQLTVIVAVGPQNVVLLKQGVRRWGVGLVVSVFIIGDLVLLPLGTAGIGAVVDRAPWLLEVLRWGGVAYLLCFAVMCFRDVRDPGAIELGEVTTGSDTDPGRPTIQSLDRSADRSADQGQVAVLTRTPQVATTPSAVAALPTALAVTFLNPAAYVDGLVVFGSMANQYDSVGRWIFTAGALVGSALFFLAVGYGARLLSRPLSSAGVWRWINLGIGLLMIAIAGRLAFGIG